MRREHTEATALINPYQYNGIDHVNEFGLDWNMATYRSHDPGIGQWGQVDPQAEYLYGMSPYCAMNNNPIRYNDPNGDIAPLVLAGIIGATVGGVGNVAANWSDITANGFNLGRAGAAFGIGAVAGGVGAMTGTYAVMGSAALGGAAAATATGVQVGGYTLGTTGFVSGSISGTVGGAVGSTLRQTGNVVAGFQDKFSYKSLLGETAFGFGFGGAVGGLTATFKGQNFWWGNSTKITPNGSIAIDDGIVEFESGDVFSGSGEKIRNSHLAGNSHPKTGVPFDESGFPDFSNSLYKNGINDVNIIPANNRVLDFAAANRAAGYSATPKGFTWHHHQAFGRMQLVKSSIHRSTGHTGGFSLWQLFFQN